MLYIFHVDTGDLMTFDIQLALQSVAELKLTIEREYEVPAAYQILLMSGGESLEDTARVCSYVAGTDTNPLYLFSKTVIQKKIPPALHNEYVNDVELIEQIKGALVLPPTYETLVVRAQLAQQCCFLGREQERTCETLVHDQHLQQQGWAAMVANVEDITQSFQLRTDWLQQYFKEYLAEREQHIPLLNNFHADLGILAKIPILPALCAESPDVLSLDNQPPEASDQNDEDLSLLKWISVNDNRNRIEHTAEQCIRGLQEYDERILEAFKNDVNVALDAANKPEMKEIKGLGERLFALEQLIAQTKRLVQEQNELAQGILHNQTRANNLGDPSVLPTLSTSHRRQLIVMMENQTQLKDIKRRCTRAKEELSANIYHRLKWIMYVQNKMADTQGKIFIYYENLKLLRHNLQVLRQVHLAPQLYVSAVVEVVRRRTFSQAFLVWANNIARQLLVIHNEEITRRREFQSNFEGHFLSSLFPGLEDIPPTFATEAPTVFDSELPKLSVDDMKSLRHQLPDLIESVSASDLNTITQFFSSRSKISMDGDKNEDSSTLTQVAVPPKQDDDERVSMNRTSLESDSDTEEFGKIGEDDNGKTCYETKEKWKEQLEVGGSQSVSPVSTNISSLNCRVDSNPSTALCPLIECIENNEPSTLAINPMKSVKCDGYQQQQEQQTDSGGSSPYADTANCDFMGTEFYMDESLPSSLSEHHSDSHHLAIINLLQENLGNTRAEAERLRLILRTVKTAMAESTSAFRKELTILREKVIDDKSGINGMFGNINQVLVVHSRECERALCEREQQLIIDHELELANAKKLLEARDEEICNLKRSIMDKNIELSEQECLIVKMRKEFEGEQTKMQNTQRMLQKQLDEVIKQAKIDKEKAVEKNNEERLAETASLSSTVDQFRHQIKKLEEDLAATEAGQEKLVKDLTDKMQSQHKAEIETMRSRFKLMAASTALEKSPSNSSLEKIERPDAIDLSNHEAILSHAKEDMNAEKDVAIQKAIEKSTITLESKFQYGVHFAETQFEQKAKAHRLREASLIEKCEQYQEIIRRLSEDNIRVRRRLSEMVAKLEEENYRLEKEMAERKMLKQREIQIHELKKEHNELCQELNESKMKISLSALTTLVDDTLRSLMSSSIDDIEVSESKKVRLETTPTDERLSKRLEALESDNKRLASAFHAVHESKEAMEAKIEALETNNVMLEVELVQERSKRNFLTDSLSSCDKDMDNSVAVETASSQEAQSPLEQCRRLYACFRYRENLIKNITDPFHRSCVSLRNCNIGDTVIVLWDTIRSAYIILQESKAVHFLHSECVDTLDLRPGSDGMPKEIYMVARVVQKQYCHARKRVNRYQVPLGTKFYQIRVKPLLREVELEASSSDKSQQ